MAEGARIAEGLGADIIDINMGCPAREVTGKLSGSALMRDLDHATALIEAVVGAVAVPVTLKMRLGWDDANRNAPELARRAEAAGVASSRCTAAPAASTSRATADWAFVRNVTRSGAHSRGGQRRHPRPGGARAAPWRLRRAAPSWSAGAPAARPGCSRASPPRSPRATTPDSPPLARQGAIALAHVEAIIEQDGADRRPAQRPQAHRLVSRIQRPAGGNGEGLAPAAVHQRGRARGAGRPRPVLRCKPWRRRHETREPEPRERAAAPSAAPAHRARPAAGRPAAPDPGAGRRRPRALRQRRGRIVLLAQPGRAQAPDAARHHRLLEPARPPWWGRCGAPAPPSTSTRSRWACRAATPTSWWTCSPAPCRSCRA